MTCKDEGLENLTSKELDEIARAALPLAKRYLESEEVPSEHFTKRTLFGMRMIEKANSRHSSESRRCALAIRVAAMGVGLDNVSDAIKPVVNAGVSISAGAEVAQVADQRVTGQIEAPSQTARKRSGK